MKGSHLFWLSRSKGMTVDIWIRDYNPPRCFQKKISGMSNIMFTKDKVAMEKYLKKNYSY
jgi:hypothetical protein